MELLGLVPTDWGSNMLWFNNMTTQGATSGSTDPYFSNVILLMHMDGTNGGTTFTDVKGHTVTPTSCTTSTTQFKYGTASGVFNGASSKLVITTTSGEFDFGTGDFTVECFVRFFNPANGSVIFGGTSSSSQAGNLSLYVIADNTLRIIGGGNIVDFVGTSFSASTWYHIAICRSGTNMRAFVNGTQYGSTATSNTTNFSSGASSYIIGQFTDGVQFLWSYLDEVRITKGVARYTSNFTAPTAAFPDS